MFDNLTGSESAPGDPLVGEFAWTRQSNEFGWSRYLGDHPAEAPYVPARVASVDGCPAWMFTVSLDLFRDENIEYARRLLAAGGYRTGGHARHVMPFRHCLTRP